MGSRRRRDAWTAGATSAASPLSPPRRRPVRRRRVRRHGDARPRRCGAEIVADPASPRAAGWSPPAATRGACGPTTTPTTRPCSSASSPTAGRAAGGPSTAPSNVDWEDIAAGPGPEPGQHYLYVGDIGDNTGPGTRSSSTGWSSRPCRPDAAATASPPPPPPSASATTTAPTTPRASWCTPPPATSTSSPRRTGAAGVYRAPARGGRPHPDRHPRPRAVRPGHRRRHLPRRAAGGPVHPVRRLRARPSTPAAGRADFDAIWAQPPVAVALPARQPGGGHRLPPRRRRPAS